MVWNLLGLVAMAMNSTNGLGDMKEWKCEGSAAVQVETVAFGSGAGAVQLSLKSKGLNIYYLEANAKTPGSKSKVTLIASCLNASGKTVYEVTSTSAADKEESKLGLYFKTHLDTKMLRIRIEKTGAGEALVSGVVVRDEDANRGIHKPKIDLKQYTLPVWEGPVAYDESAVFIGNENQELSSKLLFKPDKVLTVTNAERTIVYEEGKDFKIAGDEIVRLKDSRMPLVNPSDIPKGDLPWYQINGKHVLVTYKHSGENQGPKPDDAKQVLPETYRKLQTKQPLKIAAIGDSITLGTGTSGYSIIPPYMPPWLELLAYRWSRVFGSKSIKAVNLSLGGQTTYWAKDIAPTCASSLMPDLVLIAFGMNDFWSISPEEFKANIQSIIATIRSQNEKAEFVLISSIPFDPDYSTEKYYLGNINGYPEMLKSLAGKGIAYVDMNAIGKYLSEVKGHKSLTGDPMHPNDYLARWYSSAVVSLLDRRVEKQK